MSDSFRLLDGLNIFRRAFGYGSNNNKYISQPDFKYYPLSFDRSEQWISLENKEREIYLTTAQLRIVIDRLALMFSNGCWKHYNANGEMIENSDVVSLLDNPNVLQSRNEFLFQFMVHRCLYGNDFIYQLKGFEGFDIPDALWHLSPSRMKIERTGKIWQQTDINEIISEYRFDLGNSQDEIFTPDQIIQFSMPNPDDPVLAPSPLAAIKMELSNLRAAKGYRNVILTKKGAIGVWSSDAKDVAGTVNLTEREQKQMSAQLTETYGIGDNQASVMVSSKPLKWTPAVYPTKDLELFKEVDEDIKPIIDLYGANENMFSRSSDGKGSTFNNVNAGEKQCYQNTIKPIADDLSNGLAKRFGLLDRGESLELDFSHLPIMQEDEKEKAEVIEKKARAAQILLANGYSPEQVNELMEWNLNGGTGPTV